MKFSPPLFRIYAVLLCALLFSCSSDLELPLTWEELQSSASVIKSSSSETKSNPVSSSSVSTSASNSSILTDSRDGQSYGTVTISNKTWMAKNLNYNAPSGSKCYDCDKYGRLYNWETARIVCPTGWHLPTQTEWNSLIGKNLKSTSDFAALLGGGYSYDGGDFIGVGNLGIWWTDTKFDNSNAYTVYVHSYDNEVETDIYDYKTDFYSVRCVKD